jgi:hypothetical protein
MQSEVFGPGPGAHADRRVHTARSYDRFDRFVNDEQEPPRRDRDGSEGFTVRDSEVLGGSQNL